MCKMSYESKQYTIASLMINNVVGYSLLILNINLNLSGIKVDPNNFI